MTAHYFVTGTDTEIGKTHAVCTLLHAAQNQGRRALGMKPIAAGIEADGSNDDVHRIIAASNVTADLALINPYCFASPIAPHLAAAEEGRRIEAAPILAAYRQLATQTDTLIVEGVGGFRVPLGENFDSADLAVALGLPLILVVGMKLGCINHALLTAEAIAARGLTLAGWIANRIDPQMARFEANLQSLVGLLPAPLLGVLPHGLAPAEAAAEIHFPA